MYSIGRSCGRVRFWLHEGQKERQIERKREIHCIPKRKASSESKEKYTRHKPQIRYRYHDQIYIYAKEKEENKFIVF